MKEIVRTICGWQVQWIADHFLLKFDRNRWEPRCSDVQESKKVEVGTQQLRRDGGKVIKHFSRDLQLEALKHHQLAQIGSRQGFRLPELLDQDVAAGTLTYEFIADLISCRQHYLDYALRSSDGSRDRWHEGIFHRIGQTLAIMHGELDIQPRVSWRPPTVFEQVIFAFTGQNTDKLLSTTRSALLHGDFGFSNVCHTRQDPQQLIMIDPSPNQYSSFVCNEYASVYLDIAKFSLCLRGLVPSKCFLRLRRARAARLRELFLQGYANVAGMDIDNHVLQVVERAHLTSKIRHEMRSSWARIAAGIMIFGLKDGKEIGRIANAR